MRYYKFFFTLCNIKLPADEPNFCYDESQKCLDLDEIETELQVCHKQLISEKSDDTMTLWIVVKSEIKFPSDVNAFDVAQGILKEKLGLGVLANTVIDANFIKNGIVFKVVTIVDKILILEIARALLKKSHINLVDADKEL